MDEHGCYNAVLYGDLYTLYDFNITSVFRRTNRKGTTAIKNDVLFPSSTTVDSISLISPACLDINEAETSGCFIIRPKEGINGYFVSLYTKGNSRQRLKLAKNAQGITIIHLYYQLIAEDTIFIPSAEEQTEICDFFSTIFNYEHKLGDKLNALKKYKRGLQKMLYSTNIVSYKRLIDLVSFQPKSKYGAGSGINNGSYPFYLSGDKASFLNQYMFDGRYVIANDGGEANFKITNGKFSYSDHCICFKGHSDTMTNYIYNYLDMLKDKITYIGFVGSGLKNIDREYFETLEIPIASEKDIIKCVHIFTILDNYINGCLNRIDEIKLLRKYLLGNMFI